MTIHIGGAEANAIKIGGADASAVYVGAEQIWPTAVAGPPGLDSYRMHHSNYATNSADYYVANQGYDPASNPTWQSPNVIPRWRGDLQPFTTGAENTQHKTLGMQVIMDTTADSTASEPVRYTYSSLDFMTPKSSSGTRRTCSLLPLQKINPGSNQIEFKGQLDAYGQVSNNNYFIGVQLWLCECGEPSSGPQDDYVVLPKGAHHLLWDERFAMGGNATNGYPKIVKTIETTQPYLYLFASVTTDSKDGFRMMIGDVRVNNPSRIGDRIKDALKRKADANSTKEIDCD